MRKLVFCALALPLAFVAPADAVVTATWSVDDYKQFDEGEANDAFITSLGEVKPGWSTTSGELDFSGAWSAVRLGRVSLAVLMDAVPKGVDMDGLRDLMLEDPLVTDAHHLHLRALDGETLSFTAHVQSEFASPARKAMSASLPTPVFR